MGGLDGQPNLLTFTDKNEENYLDDEDEWDKDLIGYGSENESQDEVHDSVEIITGVKSEIIMKTVTLPTVMMMKS